MRTGLDRRWALAGLLLAAGCSPQKPAPSVHDSMSQVVAPQAQVIWDITNRAMNEQGNPDPSKMTDKDWTQIAGAGEQLKDRAQTLAGAKKLTVAVQGVKIQDETSPEGHSAAQVQGYIDANPKAFADHAKVLAQTGEALAAAAKAKDMAKVAEVSNSLDQVCETCHLQFWYPPKK
jgi:cytochrome c556